MKEIKWTDKERDEAIRNMGMDEILAYSRGFYRRILDDPETLAKRPPGWIDRLRESIDGLENAIKIVKILDRNAGPHARNPDIAQARFGRLARHVLVNIYPDNYSN